MKHYERVLMELIELIMLDIANGGLVVDMDEVEKAETMYEEL
jgi:hypothetical protein